MHVRRWCFWVSVDVLPRGVWQKVYFLFCLQFPEHVGALWSRILTDSVAFLLVLYDSRCKYRILSDTNFNVYNFVSYSTAMPYFLPITPSFKVIHILNCFTSFIVISVWLLHWVFIMYSKILLLRPSLGQLKCGLVDGVVSLWGLKIKG